MAAVIEARGITRDYLTSGGFFGRSNWVRALKGIDFTVEEGKTLAIVGESGCGKSTLARIITLIDPASGGELLLDGKAVNIAKGAPSREMRRKVADRVPEPLWLAEPAPEGGRHADGTALPEHRPYGGGTAGRSAGDAGEGRAEARTFQPLPPHVLGGQRQRLAIARALMVRPKLLVLDEPVSALDLSVQAQVLNLLADLQDEFNLTYVFISHDLSVVKYIADDVMVMFKGEVVEYGTREKVFGTPEHDYTRTLFAATPKADVDSIRARLARKRAA